MKLMISFLVLATLVVSCGGDKNEAQVDEGVILAVRSLEDASGLPEGERTQVAILSGDLSTPEQAEIAAENAQWIPMDSFEQDDEISFVPANQEQPNLDSVRSSMRRGHNRQGRRMNRRGRKNSRNWRPYRNYQRYWVNFQWFQPTYRYSCNHRYISYSGACYVPMSSYYNNYRWKARYHFRTKRKIAYRGYKTRKRQWRGHARIRLYW